MRSCSCIRQTTPASPFMLPSGNRLICEIIALSHTCCCPGIPILCAFILAHNCYSVILQQNRSDEPTIKFYMVRSIEDAGGGSTLALLLCIYRKQKSKRTRIVFADHCPLLNISIFWLCFRLHLFWSTIFFRPLSFFGFFVPLERFISFHLLGIQKPLFTSPDSKEIFSQKKAASVRLDASRTWLVSIAQHLFGAESSADMHNDFFHLSNHHPYHAINVIFKPWQSFVCERACFPKFGHFGKSGSHFAVICLMGRVAMHPTSLTWNANVAFEDGFSNFAQTFVPILHRMRFFRELAN